MRWSPSCWPTRWNEESEGVDHPDTNGAVSLCQCIIEMVPASAAPGSRAGLHPCRHRHPRSVARDQRGAAIALRKRTIARSMSLGKRNAPASLFSLSGRLARLRRLIRVAYVAFKARSLAESTIAVSNSSGCCRLRQRALQALVLPATYPAPRHCTLQNNILCTFMYSNVPEACFMPLQPDADTAP